MTTCSTSLACIALTIVCFSVGSWIYTSSRKNPVLQPVSIATALIAVVLIATGLPYNKYFDATGPLHDLLGPAVVALAVPLYENMRRARNMLLPIVGATLLSGTVVTGSALLLGRAFRLHPLLERSLGTKSVTTPIALSIADKIGGAVPLTVLGVFVTGVAGVTCTPFLLHLVGVDNPAAKGFTLGLTSHTFGITRATELGSEAVAFATLGMALMGCASAVIVPAIFRLL